MYVHADSFVSGSGSGDGDGSKFLVYCSLERPAQRGALSNERLKTSEEDGNRNEEEEVEGEQEESSLDFAFMKGVTQVDAEWVADLAAGTPLLSPPLRDLRPLPSPAPRYSAERDRVEAFVQPRFGSHGWALPPRRVPLADQRFGAPAGGGGGGGQGLGGSESGEEAAVRWFARLLLEGKVVAALGDALDAAVSATAANAKARTTAGHSGKQHAALKVPPSATTHSRTNAAAEALVSALRRGQEGSGGRSPIITRTALAVAWRCDPHFLRSELLACVRQSAAEAVASVWGKVVGHQQ